MAPRNIAILSDGTGNSAAKIAKTNIWRIYELLDLEKGDQIAFYDDGVGTGGSRIVRAIGGAFGYGLARNVRNLYEELCRHYQGQENGGDNLYLFGFSRGAFTARVLSGVIGCCGIVDRDPQKNHKVPVWRWSHMRWEQVPVSTDEGLKAASRIAYRSLRLQFKNKFPLIKIYRFFRDQVLRFDTPTIDEFKSKYAVSQDPQIRFLGVFDTVSAYGLPVDEMTIVIDRYILPLRFPDNILAGCVENACQALALDEARQTFHPVLWTEDGDAIDPETLAAYKRAKQAWFAGVHADVGGGYPDDRLSFVPGLWMIEQAGATGLRFRKAAVEDLAGRATIDGDLHDSRRGLAAFYRYKPRLLDQLGHEDLDGDGKMEVEVGRFKIHHSVFELIRETGADYAPAGIPADYDVVMPPTAQDRKANRLNVVRADKAGYETADERANRATVQKNIEDTIFFRRTAFFCHIDLRAADAGDSLSVATQSCGHSRGVCRESRRTARMAAGADIDSGNGADQPVLDTKPMAAVCTSCRLCNLLAGLGIPCGLDAEADAEGLGAPCGKSREKSQTEAAICGQLAPIRGQGA